VETTALQYGNGPFWPYEPANGSAGRNAVFLPAELLPYTQPETTARPVPPVSTVEPVQHALVYDRNARLLDLPRSRYSWYA